MSLHIYTDEDVNPLLAEILQERNYLATSAHECEHLGLSDEEHLIYATQQKYTILTHNIRDFCELAKTFAQKKTSHYGIILSPQWEFSKLLRATLRLLNEWQTRDASNQLIWLHRYATEKNF